MVNTFSHTEDDPIAHINSDELSLSHTSLSSRSALRLGALRRNAMTVSKESFLCCLAVSNIKRCSPGRAKRPEQCKTEEETGIIVDRAVFHAYESMSYHSVPEYMTHWRESQPARAQTVRG